MRRSVACLLLVPALLLTACGDDTDVQTGDEPSTDGSADGGSTPVGDQTEVAISIEVGGGFVPFGYDFATVPTVIQDNGTAFIGGAVMAIFPGPALSPVVTGVIEADDLAELLDRAEQVGLASDSELDGGQPGITDMPTTTIKVRVGGEVYEHSIYGLNAAVEVPDAAETGLTEEQIEVRRAVSGFVAEVTEAASTAASEPYEAEAYDLLSEPLSDMDTTADVEPNQLDWPFSYPIPSDGACVHLEGDDAATFSRLLPKATQITEWTDATDGAKYRITVRAVIPGFEREC